MGIAPPDTREIMPRFDAWLKNGHQGTMDWLVRGRNKRADLNNVLPGIESVICLRTNYQTQTRQLDYLEDPATGDITCYGWNLDYHDIIEPRLKTLEAELQNLFPGCTTRRYVDTGPVPEKPLAEQAGLGWIGKHTNLLTEGVGSWYFLSEILIDVALPYSTPAENHCGPCTACIDICPTGAIIEPYVLDSRRCISYLTIENKGMIPLEFRKALGNRIYGCDDCQIVCPWNEDATVTPEPAFQERTGTKLLTELMLLDDVGFRERFRKSPVKRIKRRGLLRNVAVALGNSGDAGAIPVLKDALADDEPLIRAHVVWALGELLGAEAVSTIRFILTNETHPDVTEEIKRLSPTG
ncbi:MAG: tRNA epoxyqueuosine(34) reductase QueG [Candidatus Nitronauta litoralis]|uniref:tRNA epoxyqueuosine(34) reductase QueG n=1 Tax=Candidatus Nitronauta litoralis TaxID=2705533 RepID=A0A7T0G233_9BACT|nr:MAG: tRNA epoxyqueuosine(34) reductase QueG [Candidatus Nitronauta litoralis]